MLESPTSWTVADCLKMAASLALPAFQRGAVWDRSAAARLLESLDDGFFVGSLLIWHPVRLQQAAEPLMPGWPLASLPSLVIDGQQRLRAILAVFLLGHRFRRQELPTGREAWTGRLWCARLEGDHLRFSLRAFPGNRQETDWVPVTFLELPASACPGRWRPGPDDVFAWEESSGRGKAKTKSWRECELTLDAWRQEFSEQAATGTDLAELQRRVVQLLDARLVVVELREADGRWSEAEVVENYRRLNDAGERLKQEELDYASLVQLARSAPVASHLEALIYARPGGAVDSDVDAEAEARSAGVEPDDVSRDELLGRGSDREFGLKLFVRTVRQVRGYQQGRTSPSKKLPEPTAMSGSPDAADLWMSEAASVLVAVAQTLRGLELDWRSRIPRDGMGRLRPMELLLVRFPGLRSEAAAPILRAIALRLLIHPSPPADDELAGLVFGVGTGADAAEDLLVALRFESPALVAMLRDDLSPRSRWKDLLYFLLRSRHALDIPADGSEPRRLTASMSPEAQHIVPFSRIQSEERLKRSSRHAINAVGNITWISHRANTLGTGWEAQFMTLDADPENAARHLLGSGTYDQISRRYADSDVPESVVAEFVADRAERIALALHAWCEAEELEASKVLEGSGHRFGGFAPRRDTTSDILLGWGYPPSLVRRLSRVAQRAYARTSASATGWKSSGHSRARWVEGQDPKEMKAKGRAEFEVRLAGDAEPFADRLVLSRAVLSVPAVTGAPLEISSVELADCDLTRQAEEALDLLVSSRGDSPES